MSHTTRLLIIFLSILLAFCLLQSCMTAKNLPKHNEKFPADAALWCALKYPAKDSISEKLTTVYDTAYAVLHDTLIVCDSLSEGVSVKYVQLPSKVITKTINKETYVVRVDSALAHGLRLRLLQMEQRAVTAESEAKEWKGKAKSRWWIIVVFILGAALGLFLSSKIKSLPKLPKL